MTLLHHFVISNIHMYTNLLYNVINVNVFFGKIKPANEKFKSSVCGRNETPKVKKSTLYKVWSNRTLGRAVWVGGWYSVDGGREGGRYSADRKGSAKLHRCRTWIAVWAFRQFPGGGTDSARGQSEACAPETPESTRSFCRLRVSER